MTEEKLLPEESAPPKGATSAQLKADIDSGRTGDKIGHPDPAASPLGTDDEAAGHAPSAEQIAHARAQENRRPPQPSGEQPIKKSRVKFWIWSVGAVIFLAFIMALMRG
jgi:hypothetical protein